ncbi:ATP-dependent helicase HrpB [Saccharophagus degradans]|uniref:ATP-dependent helicase HrpB n=1 Tax=Saccharophagus degradans TaxID=86304 RepID=UPI001C0866DD|nr:ATP-dependent helicase HrpB [Saccharophagus degradans]MBU2987174.1 ATP-dependent helicase HrpB [Saccharophagus degradans]
MVDITTVITNLSLPINDAIPAIEATLLASNELVLEAPPGAGKTTVVPLALLNAPWRNGKKIIVLEPRRLAARNAASRMASLLGERCAETVGYRVRMDNSVGANTVIEVVTEGVFTRMLQADPTLDDVAIVIFDEFHERSLDADLGLALLQQSSVLYGDMREQPIKTLVMSATLNGSQLSDYLGGAPVVTSEGRMFSVDVAYSDPYTPQQDSAARAAQAVKKAIAEYKGSILVFLPGRKEIEACARALRNCLEAGELPKTLAICPLYGDLSLADQQQAIAPAGAGVIKVVLATNIAESSLTIEGVSIVVDSGLQREARYDPNTGMTRLNLCRISKASAEQRAGRAGRLEPGVCMRLWSKSQQSELAQYASPEIQHADMVPLALQLLQWGEADCAQIPWLDAPAPARYTQAIELLEQLEALKDSGGGISLTALGEAMASLPVHPRLAHMLVVAKQLALQDLACTLAALLSERDIGTANMGADFSRRAHWLQQPQRAPKQLQGALKRLSALKKMLAQQLNRAKSPSLERALAVSEVGVLSQQEQIALLLAFAFPDRIARARKNNPTQYLLANGRQANLFNDDSLVGEEWLVVAEASSQQGRSNDIIRLAAPISLALLQQAFSAKLVEKNVCEWDENANRIVSEQRVALGAIILSAKQLAQADPALRVAAVRALINKKGLGVLEWTADAINLRARLQLLHTVDTNWSNWSDEMLLGAIDDWLSPYLHSVNNGADLRKVNIAEALKATLSWEQQVELDKLAPVSFCVPSGRDVPIDYSQNPPVIAAKLQELFGSAITPSIVNGKVPLLIHLLSPAGKPLQVTQDLMSFWRGAYTEVKKEMKGRYPKHPWPDDPITAMPTRKTKSQLSRT